MEKTNKRMKKQGNNVKRFAAGIVLAMLVCLGKGICSFSDAAAPELDRYYAFVSNPEGIVCDGVTIPYGERIEVDFEYREQGINYAIFSYGENNHVTPVSDISPENKPVNEYPEADMEIFTCKDTDIYSGPAYAFEKTGRIPAGVTLKVTHTSGDYFGYVESENYTGWVVFSHAPGIDKPSVMQGCDYEAHVMLKDVPVLNMDGIETGEYLAPGTAIKVIGEAMGRSEYSGEQTRFLRALCAEKEIFLDGEFISLKREEEKYIYVTSPGSITLFKGYDLINEVPGDSFLQYDQILPIYDILSYEDDVYFYCYYAIGEDYFYLNKCYDRYYVDEAEESEQEKVGFYFISHTPVFEVYKANKTVECFEDLSCTEKRSILEADIEVNVLANNFDLGYEKYIEGYGWLPGYIFDECFENVDTESASEEESAGAKENITEETKEENVVSVVEPSKVDAGKTNDTEGFVNKSKRNPERTFVLCLVFAIIIAVAAVFGIVALVKNGKKKAGEQQESLKTEENSDNL